jgi:hypothetical protein
MTARLPAAYAAHPKGRPRSGCSEPRSTIRYATRYGAMEGALARGLLRLNHVEPGCCCGTSDAGWHQFFISPDSKPEWR